LAGEKHRNVSVAFSRPICFQAEALLGAKQTVHLQRKINPRLVWTRGAFFRCVQTCSFYGHDNGFPIAL